MKTLHSHYTVFLHYMYIGLRYKIPRGGVFTNEILRFDVAMDTASVDLSSSNLLTSL